MEANDGTFGNNPDVPGSDVVMFYVDHSDNTKTNLESGTNAVFYIPFLV